VYPGVSGEHGSGKHHFPRTHPLNCIFCENKALVVPNHAFATMIPANFTVLDVFVDDQESPLVRPNVP
jgi:hypothetical protein